MTSSPNIMAIPDLDNNSAGAIVYWRLKDSADYSKLQDQWLADGHDPNLLPAPTTPMAALKRACRSMVEFRRLIRPLDKSDGYAVVDEDADRDDLRYSVQCTVKLRADDTIEITPTFFDRADTLRETYDKARNEIARNTIGSWLSALVRECCAGVTLRSTGGIYFIPAEHVAKFRAWSATFESATDSVIFELPALQSDQAVKAILDAVMTEADDTLGGIADEIDNGALGSNALKTRESRCETLRKKLESYATLLGSKLDGINDRITETEASVVEAILLAEAEKEAAKLEG